MTERELINLKEKIDTAKTEQAEAVGQQKQLMQQLKEEWACPDLKTAEALLKKLETEIAEIDISIAAGISTLQNEYNIGEANDLPY